MSSISASALLGGVARVQRLPYAVGNYYPPSFPVAFTAASALSANVLYATPFYCSSAKTFAAVTFRNTGAGDSGVKVRVGVYADGGGKPGALVVDCGETTLGGAAATHDVTAAIVLSPGKWYWLAAVSNGTPTVSISTITAYPDPTVNAGARLYADTSGNQIEEPFWQGSLTYGALPASAPATAQTNNTGPRLWLKG